MPEIQKRTTRRKTIGVLAARVGRMWEPAFLAGILDAAEARDVNVIFFVGGKPSPILKQGESKPSFGFYDLVKSDFLSGYLYAADVAYELSTDEARAFHRSFPSRPAVANAMEVEGVVNLVADNENGMRATIRHLIREHGYRRIAFIRGPRDQLDARQRFEAYKKELEANDLRYDERLVVDGDFSAESGRAAMRTLLDERKLRIDAVAAANDRMAFGVLDVLQARGIRVPAEMAVTGFDDVTEAQLIGVPLTTVHQSYYETGYKALEMLSRRLDNATAPQRIVIPTEPVVRWSCGCLPESVHQVVLAPVEVARTGRLENKREAAVKALLKAGGISEKSHEAQRFQFLFSACWDNFLTVMRGEIKSDVFLESIETAITLMHDTGRDATAWHNFISTLRRHALAGISEKDATLHAENLFQQARMLAGELSQRFQAYYRQELEQQEELLQGFSFTMAPAMSLEEIGAAVETHFDKLGVPRGYVLFYSDVSFPQPASLPPGEEYRLLLQYDDEGLQIPADRPSVPAGRLLPKGKFPADQRFNAVVMPLTLAENRFGFIWLEMGRRDWEVYTRIRNLVSSALLRTMLVEQREIAQREVERLLGEAKRTAAALQIAKEIADQVANENALLYQSEQERRQTADGLARSARLLSSSLSLNELPPRILEQFNQLLPFSRGWLVINDPGGLPQVSATYGFPADDPQPEIDLALVNGGLYDALSRNGDPVLLNDIANAGDFFLPKGAGLDACWLAIPLISKERVNGMILVTRRQANAFGADDLLAATTFGIQASISIENARLYEEVTQFNQMMERMVAQRVDELNEAYATLYKLDKNKTDFISVSAHELRTPLTVMKGYLGMLRSNPALQADAALLQAVDGLMKGTNRLHQIVNNMLDVARLEGQVITPVFEHVNLSLVARIVQKDYLPDLEERKISLVIDESLNNLPALTADSELLQKALDCVLVNAIKFTPDGGRITVTGRTVRDERMGECVEVQVQDNGIGIAPENHRLIFEKLYQVGKVELHSSGRTKFKGGGPGLGLAIAAGIVKAHSGRIWVESPGYDEESCPGSTFFIRLPRIQRSAPRL
ncbi:MAG: substrate-binding domain-containing protein [Chloroflexota bacterium]